jgi:hypothetical protein
VAQAGGIAVAIDAGPGTQALRPKRGSTRGGVIRKPVQTFDRGVAHEAAVLDQGGFYRCVHFARDLFKGVGGFVFAGLRGQRLVECMRLTQAFGAGDGGTLVTGKT